jgi:hypothetical protein
VALRAPSFHVIRVLAAANLIAAAPAVVWSETGAEAFERQDYSAAAELWQSEAADGSAEARFGLGLIYDLGLGLPRNSAVALRWYLEAAGQGHADAQFNVAVMLDAGTGVPRDPAVAATWYARSAANGNARAQFNLAMLYENGIGVARNRDIARGWYEAARSEISAASDRLEQLPGEDQELDGSPPQPITGAVVGPPDAPRAELVWSATTKSNGFLVQVARQPSQASGLAAESYEILQSRSLSQSAVVLDVPAEETRLLWRVGRIDQTGTVSAWSSWQEIAFNVDIKDQMPAPEEAPGRLMIYVNAGDQLATSFAEELSATYSEGGLEVTIRVADRPITTTTLEYYHTADANLAASIADFLPFLGPDSAIHVSDPTIGPGAVTLNLFGGPLSSEHTGE